MFALLYYTGVLKTFWFWTVTYLSSYGTRIPLSAAPRIFLSNFGRVTNGFSLLWIFSALGLGALLLDSRFRARRTTLLLFTVFSFLSVCPGFYFRSHYFVTLLPAVAILSGVFLDCVSAKVIKNRIVAIGLFVAAFIPALFREGAYLFKEDPLTLSRKIYGANPFPESIEIAEFIRERTKEGDTIAVLGSEPQLFFYSRRRSATGFLYMYGLMEKHQFSLTMQKEMSGEIESSRPKYFVDVHVPTSWLVQPDSERYIFNWAKRYLSEYYTLAGVADIFADVTRYVWGEDARRYQVRSKQYIRIYERK